MNKFALAFPNSRGNSWQHYTIYFVDVTQGTVMREITSHDNHMGVADYYEYHGGSVFRTFKHRINPKLNKEDGGLALGRYISNGKLPSRYFGGVEGDCAVDIRFVPVNVNYFTGGVVRMGGDDCALSSAAHQLCWQHCDSQAYYGGGYSYTARNDLHRLILITGLLAIFNQMSSSQARFVARSYPHEPPVKSIRSQVYLLMNTFRTRGTKEADDIISQLYPSGLDISLIEKSIKRRLRKIPNATAATKKFLTMMAASCSLKNLFTRLRKANLTNETK